MKLVVKTKEKKEPLGDLFGIFFEDINHAADGGLYGELVQNGAFEYSEIDNREYRPLTAWEKLEEGGAMDWLVKTEDPVSVCNPHYLVLNVTIPGTRMGVRNIGYNTGISIEKGETYLFSCYVRGEDSVQSLRASLCDTAGGEIAGADFYVENKWKKIELSLQATKTDHCGRLAILISGTGKAELDFVSLFPKHTYKNRKNGLRRDIAQMLAELTPKFVRFPGGCLTHDGSLEKGERDAMYFWKNSVWKKEQRAARRNNWNYHQSLGLGYYEYFQFCEDIGAEPLPVIPAAYNPHSGQAVPISEMNVWVEDALDLIEFANGPKTGKWGSVRAEMGHPEPFHMKYLGIGNEEVGSAFFERYAILHRAIREKYPEIQLINSAGPWAYGEAFERGWNSADENGSDFVDEHFYQAPEWFIANSHRYDSLPHKGKVFLGEYASCGNTWYNALAEAAFMTGIEKNAKRIGLACYAPLLANIDYVNWTPDLIWFDNHRVMGSPSYYVQKLFMNQQGMVRLEVCAEEEQQICMEKVTDCITGKCYLEALQSEIIYENSNRKEISKGCLLDGQREEIYPDLEGSALEFYVKQHGSGHGFQILFGSEDGENGYILTVGGWENENVFFARKINGITSVYGQQSFRLKPEQEYKAKLLLQGRRAEFYMNNELLIRTEFPVLYMEPLYYTASMDADGAVIVKLVNVSGKEQEVEINFDGMREARGSVWKMEGYERDAVNTLDDPELVSPVKQSVVIEDGVLKTILPEDSLRVYRIYPDKPVVSIF